MRSKALLRIGSMCLIVEVVIFFLKDVVFYLFLSFSVSSVLRLRQYSWPRWPPARRPIVEPAEAVGQQRKRHGVGEEDGLEQPKHAVSERKRECPRQRDHYAEVTYSLQFGDDPGLAPPAQRVRHDCLATVGDKDPSAERDNRCRDGCELGVGGVEASEHRRR